MGQELIIQFLGVLISFIAVIGWAFMSVISRKISNKYSALTLTKVSMLIATVCNIPVSFLEVQVTHPLIQVDLGAVLGLVYMGVVCTAFTNILWNKVYHYYLLILVVLFIQFKH